MSIYSRTVACLSNCIFILKANEAGNSSGMEFFTFGKVHLFTIYHFTVVRSGHFRTNLLPGLALSLSFSSSLYKLCLCSILWWWWWWRTSSTLHGFIQRKSCSIKYSDLYSCYINAESSEDMETTYDKQHLTPTDGLSGTERQYHHKTQFLFLAINWYHSL